MILKFSANEADVLTTDELWEKISTACRWNKVACDDHNHLYTFTDENGRKGVYDVVTDGLEWDDGEDSSLFSREDDYKDIHLGSLLEFLDVTTALWCEDEDGNDVLYVEY